LAQLQAHFYTNAGHNMFLTKELLQLLQLFDAHGILALPYKGPVLAVSAYGTLVFRQFGDLDILVRTRDALPARNLLLAHGYQQTFHARVALFERFRKVDELVRADEQVLVELHRAITSHTFFFPLALAPLWARAQPVLLAGTPVQSLAPEDLLLILCVHGAKHYWSRLGWIYDVAALLHRQPGLDWGQIVVQASRLGGKRMLWLGLRLAHDLCGTALPETIERQLQADRVLPWLAMQVQSRLFTAPESPASAIDHPAFYLRLRERLRDRLPCYLYLTYRTLLPDVLKSRVGRDSRLRARNAGGLKGAAEPSGLRIE
jgi:hypothetical protein